MPDLCQLSSVSCAWPLIPVTITRRQANLGLGPGMEFVRILFSINHYDVYIYIFMHYLYNMLFPFMPAIDAESNLKAILTPSSYGIYF